MRSIAGNAGNCSRISLCAVIAFSAFAAAPAIAVEPGASAEVSYEMLWLPKTQYTFVFNNVTAFAPNSNVSRDTNHDGETDGVRVDASFGVRTALFGAMPVVVGVKGYYAHHDGGSQTSSCFSSSNSALCARNPLSDPNRFTQQIGVFGIGSTVVTTTDIKATTWGVALELQGAPSSATGIASKIGIGYRRIDQSMSLETHRVAPLTPIPGTVGEETGTGYLGLYLGGTAKLPLGGGLAITGDAEGGLYWAHTKYDAAYSSSGSGIASTDVSQSFSDSNDSLAVILAAKLGLEKDFGPFKGELFARGEFYSYAPQIRYSDVDRTGPTATAFGGATDGTSIGQGHAWTASFGGRVTVPFGQ